MKFQLSSLLALSCAVAASAGLIQPRAGRNEPLSKEDIEQYAAKGMCRYYLSKPGKLFGLSYTEGVGPCSKFCKEKSRTARCKAPRYNGDGREIKTEADLGNLPPTGTVEGEGDKWKYVQSTCNCETPAGVDDAVDKGFEKFAEQARAAAGVVCAVLKESFDKGLMLATTLGPAGWANKIVDKAHSLINLMLKFSDLTDKPNTLKRVTKEMCGIEEIPKVSYTKLFNYLKGDGNEPYPCFLKEERDCQSPVVPQMRQGEVADAIYFMSLRNMGLENKLSAQDKALLAKYEKIVRGN